MQGRNMIGAWRMSGALLLLSLGIWNGGAQTFTDASELVALAGAPTVLGNPVYTNGQVQFQMTGGIQGVGYSFQCSTDLVNWTTIATNIYPNRPFTNVPAPGAPCFYRLSRSPIPLGAYAVGVVSNITFNGVGVCTTSFNSSDPNQSTNGLYNGYAGTNGNVASEYGLVYLGNHTIQGSLYLGPFGSYDENGTVTGQVYSDFNLQFPDVVLPPVTWQTAPASTIHGVTTHDFTSANNNGYYGLGDSGGIIVEAGVTATLLFTNTTFYPTSITINGGTTNSGTLIVYQEAGAATLNGSTSSGPSGNRARNLIYLGMPAVTNVTASGGTVTAVVYAPEATFHTGSGFVAYFIGSCTVGSMTVNGSFMFIHDDDLLTSGPFY